MVQREWFGSSLVKILGDEKLFQIYPSSRKDTDLFSLDETIKKIDSEKPDIIINAAAMVGGIYTQIIQKKSRFHHQ